MSRPEAGLNALAALQEIEGATVVRVRSMAESTDARSVPHPMPKTLITYQSPNVDRFKRSIAKTIVCEVRFPTVLELGDSRLPGNLIKLLRKSYPIAERANELTLGGAAAQSPNFMHVLRSSKQKWAVSFKPSAINLESTEYGGYSELRRRAIEMIAAIKGVIDTDEFLRVGLRFINVIETDGEDPASGWVNEKLLCPLDGETFEQIADYGGRLGATTEEGGLLLQHGLNFVEGRKIPNYVIDVDAYRSEIPVKDFEVVLDELHSICFNVFDWSIGDKTREYLSIGAK